VKTTFTSQSTPNHACEESRPLGEIFCDASKQEEGVLTSYVPGSALKLELKKLTYLKKQTF
jgi:hypothetical protein